VNDLSTPRLHASPFGLLRSGVRWMRPSGAHVAAREPVAVCSIRLARPREPGIQVPFAEELHDLQVVLASEVEGEISYGAGLSR
jgi:hypothetical protein